MRTVLRADNKLPIYISNKVSVQPHHQLLAVSNQAADERLPVAPLTGRRAASCALESPGHI